MTHVDHSMKDMSDVGFKEFSTQNHDVCVYTPDMYGYDGLEFTILTLLSTPGDVESKVRYTVVEYIVQVPVGSKVESEFISTYLQEGGDAALSTIERRLIEVGYAGKHAPYTSLSVMVNDSSQWGPGGQLRFKATANIHDVENVGSVADFYAAFVEAFADVFGLKVTGEADA